MHKMEDVERIMQSNEYDWIDERREAARLKLIVAAKEYAKKVRNAFKGEYQWDSLIEKELLEALHDNEEAQIMR